MTNMNNKKFDIIKRHRQYAIKLNNEKQVIIIHKNIEIFQLLSNIISKENKIVFASHLQIKCDLLRLIVEDNLIQDFIIIRNFDEIEYGMKKIPIEENNFVKTISNKFYYKILFECLLDSFEKIKVNYLLGVYYLLMDIGKLDNRIMIDLISTIEMSMLNFHVNKIRYILKKNISEDKINENIYLHNYKLFKIASVLSVFNEDANKTEAILFCKEKRIINSYVITIIINILLMIYNQNFGFINKNNTKEIYKLHIKEVFRKYYG